MSKINIGDFNNSSYMMFGDHNVQNNTTVNNYNCRINLSNRNDGQEYEYDMFCIGCYKHNKKPNQGYVRATCINIHSNHMFIADHIQVDFPESKFDDHMFNYSLVKVKAIVNPYTRGNNTSDFGLVVTKIISINNRLGNYKNQFGIQKAIFPTEDQKEFFKYETLNLFSHDLLVEILSEQIGYLEGQVAMLNQTHSGFISNMILTYYFLNTKKSDIENKSLYLSMLNSEILYDLLFILSHLMEQMNSGEIYMWRQFIKELNKSCNVIQGVNQNVTLFQGKKNDVIRKINENIKEFSNKIDSEEVKKNFEKIRIRNRDFEYQYPDDEKEYKEGLINDLTWYLIAKRHIKQSDYSEDWKEILVEK